MNPNRRSFFGMMAAAPLIAKTAAEDAAKKLAGINQRGLTSRVFVGNGFAESLGSDSLPFTERFSISKLVQKYLLKNGLPEWKKTEIREGAMQVYSLNANIAAMRSPSLVGKVHMQRKVNYKEEVDALYRRFAEMSIEGQKERFKKKFNFHL